MSNVPVKGTIKIQKVVGIRSCTNPNGGDPVTEKVTEIVEVEYNKLKFVPPSTLPKPTLARNHEFQDAANALYDQIIGTPVEKKFMTAWAMINLKHTLKGVNKIDFCNTCKRAGSQSVYGKNDCEKVCAVYKLFELARLFAEKN